MLKRKLFVAVHKLILGHFYCIFPLFFFIYLEKKGIGAVKKGMAQAKKGHDSVPYSLL